MLRILPGLIAALAVAASGWVHGLQTDRWGIDDEVVEASNRLQRIPPVVGEWYGQEQTMDARELEIAEAQGYIYRRYTNRATGAAVEVMILCGRPGPISVHPPTVCFKGAGYHLEEEPRVLSPKDAGGRSHGELFYAVFRKSAVDPVRILTIWSWSDAGPWQALEDPRVVFASRPFLYKMYVTRPITSDPIDVENDPAVEFLELFLPHVQTAFAGA